MKITERLFELRDEKYAEFQAKLTPTVEPELFIGVRLPEIRKLAKEYIRETESKEFLKLLPHKYYDENMLHGMLISEIKDYEKCMDYLEKFLPYIDNWAVCDTLSPKVFKKNRDRLLTKVKEWSASKDTYTCRFGIGMLMSHYLDGDFRQEYLQIPNAIKSEEYYVNMMIAWYYATALAKQWDDTIRIIEEKSLGKWVHNKTIQKARESFRITAEQKEYLKSLKKN